MSYASVLVTFDASSCEASLNSVENLNANEKSNMPNGIERKIKFNICVHTMGCKIGTSHAAIAATTTTRIKLPTLIMTNQELEIFLISKCESLDLKTKAFKSLENVFLTHTMEDLDLNAIDITRVKKVFEGFEFHIGTEQYLPIIRTRISLYYEKGEDKYSPKLAYYELETDFNGEILDDYFVKL